MGSMALEHLDEPGTPGEPGRARSAWKLQEAFERVLDAKKRTEW